MSKWSIQKTVEETSDLIGKKTADRITKVSKISPQNNSKIATNVLLFENNANRTRHKEYLKITD